ncbi:MAG TPA: TonB family protein, partial [Blastocatellia bacterium]|nr:TonB family protein [Blastocatellia bacterium]
RDLNGLLIRMDAGDANASHLNVSNISLDVPDDLFQIPQGYRQVDFSTFMRPVREKMPADQRNQPPPPGAQQGLPEVDPRSGPPTVAPTPSARKDAPKKTPSGVDVGPVPLNDPKPSYTEEARRNQVQGFVRMRLFVDATGAVKQAKIIRGLPDGLDAEATKAAYERRYRPAMKNGRPVACWVDAAIEFTLEGK